MADKDPLNIVGQIVAEKYAIEKLVGEGGFAVVYRSQHTIWKKPVAIKFFNGLSSAPVSQREELLEQFINEGALLTELSSQTASIVQARDVGSYTTPDGQWMPYMVLEWLEGRPLDAILEDEQQRGAAPWPLDGVVQLLAPVAAALDVAHRKGIAHRDIKPANLFVLGPDPRAPGAPVKVLDFGVAKMMTDNTQLKAAMAKTGTNITSFTPQYGAPEQFSRSYGATGPWTDVFALALVVTELLTGRSGLQGDDVVQLAFASSNPTQRPSPRSFGATVSDAVEAVMQKALHPDPTQRFARAGEFWTALEEACGGRLAIGSTVMAPVSGGFSVMATMPPSQLPAGMPMSGSPATTAMPTTLPSTAPAGGGAGKIIAAVAVVAALGAAAYFAKRSPPPAPTAAVTASAPAPAVSAAPPAKTCPDDMVLIAAGQFFMGSDSADAMDNEKPSHNVRLDAYCIDLDEVTSGKYKACSDEGKCRRAANDVSWPGSTAADQKLYGPLCTGNDPARANHPINCVDWESAKTYCLAHDRRLPTEAEWEYATRGPDGRVYPWGDEDPTARHLNACGKECVAWSKQHKLEWEPLYDAEDGFAATAPVGSFPLGSSRFGPHDVVGNVWEWVADWDGKYGPDPQKNPVGNAAGEKKIIRGGAFNGWQKSWLRPSFRFGQAPAARSYGIGFRCAKSP